MKDLAESVSNPIDVTVVITTFNDDAVLERAIESVLKSAPPVKLVIVDDGSTPPAFIDQRYEQNPRVVIVRQTNSGLGAARDAGVQASTTDYVTFLDADDEATIDRFYKQYELAAACDKSAIVFCGTAVKVNGVVTKIRVPAQAETEITAAFIDGTFVPSGASMLISREWYQELGGFDPLIRRGSEAWFIFKAIKAGSSFHCVQEPLYIQHISSDSNSRRSEFRLESMQSIYEKIAAQLKPLSRRAPERRYFHRKIVSQLKGSLRWGASYRLKFLVIVLRAKEFNLKICCWFLVVGLSCIIPIGLRRGVS